MSRCFIGQENIQLTSSIRDKTSTYCDNSLILGKLLGDSSNNLKNMNNIIKNKISKKNDIL